MSKFTLRMGGMGLIVFSVLSAFCILIAVGTIHDMWLHGWNIIESLSGALFGLCLFVLFPPIVLERIVVELNRLDVCYVFAYGWDILPHIFHYEAKLGDIDVITVANIGYFEQHKQEFKNERLWKMIETYRHPRYGRNRRFRGAASVNTPLGYVSLKSGEENGFVFSTKNFSKKGISNLVWLLRDQGVNVFTEESLKL